VESACDKWAGAEIAWNAIEWVLGHDHLAGPALVEGGNLRAFIYQGAISIKQPDIAVIYSVEVDEIVIKAVKFKNASASYAGKA
jgi:hypothetical protein